MQNNIKNIFEKLNVFTADMSIEQERLTEFIANTEHFEEKTEDDIEIIRGNVRITINNYK